MNEFDYLYEKHLQDDPEEPKAVIFETGTRFKAEINGFPIYHYRFLGFDLTDAKSGTGCHYIVLLNEEFQNLTCVDREWFKSRKIIIEEAETV